MGYPIRSFICIGIFFLGFACSHGSFLKSLHVPLGLRFEKNFEELIGLELGASSFDLWQYHPELRIAYTTTRFHIAIFGQNILMEDRFLTEMAWNFRPLRTFDPLVELGYEFVWTDYEGHDWGQSSLESHFRVGFGMGIRLLAGQTGIRGKMGLSLGESRDRKYWGFSMWYNMGNWLGEL